MKVLSFLILLLPAFLFGQPFQVEEAARWEQQAQRVNIIRDNWGVPHIYGKTDADVVFGLLYAQCEDDFARVEDNYIIATGRQAEAGGQAYLYHDLRTRLFMDTLQAMAIYHDSPGWMKKLLDAFAAGANYYLYTHPEVKPRLLGRFQPWMPLMFSEGSIGGNITAVSINGLKDFYGAEATGAVDPGEEQPGDGKLSGSNGFAVAPGRSATRNALLLINPHTSFYFRTEVHLVSEEGLNAYGAVTWGQFFIYQGFNENCGWMHTSSDADTVDEYLESVGEKEGQWQYRYGQAMRPVQAEEVPLAFRTENGLRHQNFTIYRTHHGPVIRRQGDQWVSIRMMNEPLDALRQSFLRMKTKGYASFKKVMKIRTNSSNNTVFADRKGNIAYWHGNFLPRRDPSFDWEQPVDGGNPATDWQGLHRLSEIVRLHNPANGWIQNCNSTPFTAAGKNSPPKQKYPTYMAPDGENYRGINAVRVLEREPAFTLDKLIDAAFDPYLPGFEKLIPALVESYRQNAGISGPDLKAPIDLLSTWDLNDGTASVETTLAVLWGEKLMQLARSRISPGENFDAVSFTDFMIRITTPLERLDLLEQVLGELEEGFGTWKLAWGGFNRYQRLTGRMEESYDDNQPSIPVGFTASTWGSLAAYNARSYPDTRKRYGRSGNSFIAVVEFGRKRITARSVVTGGQSSDPTSPHFQDQAAMFCNGSFKEVRFYPEEVRQHAERTYRPGAEKR